MNKIEKIKSTADIRAQFLCTIDEAAELLSVGRSMMHEIQKSGKIPHKKINTSTRFRVSDIEKFAENENHFVGEYREIKRAKAKNK